MLYIEGLNAQWTKDPSRAIPLYMGMYVCLGDAYIISYYIVFFLCFFVAWDLLRVCVYGFKSSAANFLEKYPDHFISPVRLSGSAVETLFSQFKHTAGGKLSATNYANTQAAHLIKHCVTAHHSSVGYRDATLQLSECTLEKKQYNKKSK